MVHVLVSGRVILRYYYDYPSGVISPNFLTSYWLANTFILTEYYLDHHPEPPTFRTITGKLGMLLPRAASLNGGLTQRVGKRI
jgi:hypothetical protein